MSEISNTLTEGQGHGLLCPVCRVDLVMSERQGIEIDYCPKCRGVWLDRGELDKIIERSVDTVPSQSQTYASPPAPQQGEPYPSQGYYDDGHSSGHGGHRGGYRRKRSFLSDIFD